MTFVIGERWFTLSSLSEVQVKVNVSNRWHVTESDHSVGDVVRRISSASPPELLASEGDITLLGKSYLAFHSMTILSS